ncbi:MULTISPECIES: transglutaminase-like cysteine peptidase [unclassified Bradyrhizobium]|uniref:transglutaminase-like cysteine peptidase n=1 Tax=unclassified Bradyrhizobium TaxID=2631580 RepID=UPI003391AEA2
MRRIITIALGVIAAGSMWLEPVQAGLVGMPMGLQSAIQRIKLEAPTLPPMAFTQFCLRYRGECRTRPMFRGGPVRLTEERWADLKEINQVVNRGIAPERNELGVAGEQWLINPARGDCNDYAVSKRHELLERGWPARALLLSEVMVNSGEHHLILVVRTNSGDLVLDNMTPQIKPWSRVPYRWVRMQMPNSKLWATISSARV